MSNNSLVTERRKIVLSGESSKSANDAIREAFQKLQVEVYKTVKEPIIYMKPVGVNVLENEVETQEERFLLVFFPRTKNLYRLKIEVEIELSLLKL